MIQLDFILGTVSIVTALKVFYQIATAEDPEPEKPPAAIVPLTLTPQRLAAIKASLARKRRKRYAS